MDFSVRLGDGVDMNRRAALLFAALGVAWGIPYLLVKVAVGELSPAALVLIRTAAAAEITLVGVARPDGCEVFTRPDRIVSQMALSPKLALSRR